MCTDAKEVDADLAMALGVYLLSDASVGVAASETGVTRWQLEDAIESAGLVEHCGLDEDVDVAADLDELLDRTSE